MDDLVNRILSFKDSKIKNDHFTLAVNGFYATNSESAKCFLCEKELCGWEYDEHPFIEHSNHSKECALVNLHRLTGRKMVTEKRAAWRGFFKYKIGHDHLFCFYCGEWGGETYQQMVIHSKICTKKKIRGFNDQEVFVTKLMMGELNQFLQQMAFFNICIPANIVTFDISELRGGWFSVREMLEMDFKKKADVLEKIMDNDIKMCLKILDDI